jgi:hypothetical protein
VQHALLGLAIALILAIVAALAAPAYVNWNDWRATFESHATALTGTPVRIRGRIEASILPTPAFVFRDVAIGDPDKGTGVRVGEVRGILSLGPLLRGVLEAEEFVLSRPAMRLTAQADDRPILPAVLAAARATGAVALARVTVERGSLVIDDRTSGELVILDEVSAEGELRGREGPMRVDATFLRDGRRWMLRASAGRFSEEGTGRIRIALERALDGTLFDAEGMLALANGAPRFDGKVSANRRRSPGLPWQVNANVKASETSVVLDSFALTVGANAAPIDLAGQIRFEPRRGGRIEGALGARRIDLDPGSGEAAKSLAGAAALRDVLALLNDLSLQGRIDLSADAIVAGGGTLRDVKAELALQENTLALGRFEARLPGRATLTASGSSTKGAIFDGEVLLEAEDTSALLRWAIGEVVPAMPDSPALRLAGKIDWVNGRITVSGLALALGEAKINGRIETTLADGKKRTRIEANLSANGVDLDRVMPIVRALRSGMEASDFALTIDALDFRALGRSLARIDASVTRWGDALTIERFVVDDFDGLSGLARGRMAGSLERPSGRVDFELETRRPEGLMAIVAPLLGEEAAQIAATVASDARPIRLYGAAIGAGAAAGVEVTASGYIASVDVSAAAHFDTLAQSLSEASITLESSDAAKLVSLFGVEPGQEGRGRGILEILFAKADGGSLPVAARLAVPGSKLGVEGELRRGAEGRIEPRLEARLAADDLRPLLAAAARGRDGPIAAEGRARLTRKGDRFVLEGIGLSVGGSAVKGDLSLGIGEDALLAGSLAVERMPAGTLLALTIGGGRGGSSFWSAARLEPAPLAGATGKIEMSVKELGLAERLAASGAKFQLRLGTNEVAIEEFSAELAGGKLAGGGRLVRGDTLGLDGRATLSSFSVERLLAPIEGRSGVRGRGTLALTIAGNGGTPALLASSLAGQGTLALEALEIDRLDPNAIQAVLGVREDSEPRDEVGVIAALAPELAKGSLRIAKLETPLVIAGGVARSGKARVQAGPAQVIAEGNLDIGKLTLDAAVEIEIAPPPDLTLRPGMTVRWRGPLTAPERSIEASSLATAIALRAMDRETKRIEQRDRALQKRSETVPSATDAQPLASVSSAGAPDSGTPTSGMPDAAVRPRVPLPPARPRGINPSSTVTLPPLAPPIEIRPAPRVLELP